MRRASRFLTALAIAGLALAGAGCGKGKSKPIPTEGTVTLDGKPLADAQVVFHPLEGKGQVASAITGSDGSFRLTTTNTGDGAVPGDYKVTVRKKTAPPVQGMSESMSPEERMRVMKEVAMKAKDPALEKGPKGKGPPPGEIPGIYGDDKNTPLKWTIPSDGNVELRLNSKGS
jgi:hypothetical protein